VAWTSSQKSLSVIGKKQEENMKKTLMLAALAVVGFGLTAHANLAGTIHYQW
jgi:hypothetical protein